MKRISVSTCLGILLLTLSITACKKAAETSGVALAPDPSAPTPGVVDATGGFNVKVNPPAGANYYIHRDGDFDKSCTVKSDETNHADKDIVCILEVEELEGKFHGIEMVVNVPPTMCRYSLYEPFYYFGRQHGSANGVTIDLQFSAEGVFQSGSSDNPALASVAPDGTPRCAFDYTRQDGPNCCYGNYTVESTVQGQAPTTEVRSWGGKPGNCLAGSGEKVEKKDATFGLPINVMTYSKDGASLSVDLESTLILSNSGTFYFANYVTGAPPTAWMLGSNFPGNPYYLWTCYDDAMETKARIAVQIREWNDVAEFLLKVSGDPDTGGNEPIWGAPYNDFEDWDDIVTGGDFFPGMPK